MTEVDYANVDESILNTAFYWQRINFLTVHKSHEIDFYLDIPYHMFNEKRIDSRGQKEKYIFL